MLPSGPDNDTGSNLIWELAWRDLQSDEYKDNAPVLKQEIMNAVGKNDTSSFSLCESQIMRETLYRSDGDAGRLTLLKRAPMIIRVHLKPSAGSNLEEKDVLRFQGGEDAN
ncbi:hypothetical protein Brms1b_000943 [Colletotrichum noveboracense]|nr:hypothetical protein COL940_001358 [Colletotrichum noveboracense]KAJ0294512.1 hypothetical protein CBS470a_000809 [Colletotrichum nupharicola]KAJ0324717.1 hypothetical protein Brms1b_000943 [Colletotrichum noveboracense]